MAGAAPSWDEHVAARRLAGRRIVVTGAGSGIGRQTATVFAAEGARVALLDLNAAGMAETAAGIDAKAFRADISNEAEVTSAVDAAAEFLGGIDGVVNAAGITLTGLLGDMDFATWRRVMSVNLDGTFLVCRACLPWLRQATSATIVNISSGQALLPGASLSAYAASKGGVLTLTRALAVELAPLIRVNAVCPGIVDTPMVAGAVRSAAPNLSNYALRRMASALEVAQSLLFLSSHESAFVTGAALAVDGGRTYH
jgi:NAD(P)-dependent dehydrogenase (short-subunit alcohol dehydrogenase family)